MIGVLQRMLHNENPAETQETQQEIISVRQTKIRHKVWTCGDCGHNYFYGALRCPLCESSNMEESLADPVYVVFKDVVNEEGAGL